MYHVFCTSRPNLHVCECEPYLRAGPDDDPGMNADLLLTRGDSPKIIIIAISTAGALLLVLNLVLVICYVIRRRKKKCMEEGEFPPTGN